WWTGIRICSGHSFPAGGPFPATPAVNAPVPHCCVRFLLSDDRAGDCALPALRSSPVILPAGAAGFLPTPAGCWPALPVPHWWHATLPAAAPAPRPAGGSDPVHMTARLGTGRN